MRSYKNIVKDLEVKLGPLEVIAKEKTSAETVAENEDSEDNRTKTKDKEQHTQALKSLDKAKLSVIMDKTCVENAVNKEDRHYHELATEKSRSLNRSIRSLKVLVTEIATELITSQKP